MLKQGVGFSDKLHIAVFNAVVNHFHIVTRAISTDISHTRFAIFRNRSDLFQNRGNEFIRFFLAARHDGRAFQRAFFTTGNAGTDEVKAFSRQLTVTANGVVVIGITAINNNVTLIEIGLQGVDSSISASARFNHQQDTARRFERLNELLNGIVRNEFFARVLGNDFFGFFTRAVENGYGIATAFDVERQVAPHHCHTDNADLLLGHYLLLSGVFYQ